MTTEKKKLLTLIEEMASSAEWGTYPTGALMTPRMAIELGDEIGLNGIAPRGVPVSQLETPFGSIRIIASPYCPADAIYLGDADDLQRRADDTEEYMRSRLD